MWNILIGIVFIIGGLSGEMQLRFVGSPLALAAVGAGLVVWGVIQIVQSRQQSSE